ncbi:MAG TPA: hypothetical protein VEK57_13715 [Thermoanaerobaculia bacterium]|nr:hypothetical protein [Thermoanaerobaculia bacterium]
MTKVANPSPEILDALADERLEDARALLAAGRAAGARYMCGYALEMKLKALVCRNSGWGEYPPPMDGRLMQALKTHKLDDLLLLSGSRPRIQTEHPADWAIVEQWDPEERYRLGAISAQEAQAMVSAATALMAVL